MRALHDHQLRQEREARVARYRHRLLVASGIDPDQMTEQGQRIFRWLADDWDEWTIGGLVEILNATRTTAQIAVHKAIIEHKVQALRESEADVEASLARYDERDAGR